MVLLMSIIIILFILGICIGSFLNVVIYRMPEGLSIVTPRSHCFKCQKMIEWYDNIPLLSYIILRGKCRHCGAGYSPRYFLVELLTGILFLVVNWAFKGPNAASFVFTIVTCMLIAISFIDLDHFIIPDELSLSGIVFGLVVAVILCFKPTTNGLFPVENPNNLLFPVFKTWAPLVDSFLGLLLGGGILWGIGLIAQAILKKEAMGGGDVKLLAFVGAFTGWMPIILALMISSLVGSIVGIIQLYLMKRKDSETELTGHYIPFGPFLAIGSLISILWGHLIIEWYLNLLTPDVSTMINGPRGMP